jgi:hypothetical protein
VAKFVSSSKPHQPKQFPKALVPQERRNNSSWSGAIANELYEKKVKHTAKAKAELNFIFDFPLIVRARESYYAALATPKSRPGDDTGLQR